MELVIFNIIVTVRYKITVMVKYKIIVTIQARKITRSTKTADYTVTTSDYLISCDTTSNAITITLAPASTTQNQIFIISDEGGNAGTNNVTIETTGSDTINGESSAIINIAYMSLSLYSDGGTAYFVK